MSLIKLQQYTSTKTKKPLKHSPAQIFRSNFPSHVKGPISHWQRLNGFPHYTQYLVYNGVAWYEWPHKTWSCFLLHLILQCSFYFISGGWSRRDGDNSANGVTDLSSKFAFLLSPGTLWKTLHPLSLYLYFWPWFAYLST